MLLLGVILVMACLEVFGIGTIFWFLTLVMNPAQIDHYPALTESMSWIGISSTNDFMIVLGLALFLAVLSRNLFAAFTVYAQERFVLGRNLRLSLRLLDSYVRLPYLQLVRENSADLTKRVVNDVWRISTGIIFPIIDAASKAIIASAIIGFLLWTDFFLTSCVLAGMIVMSSLIYLPTRKHLQRIGEELMRTDSLRFTSLSELFGGIKDIRIFAREEFFRDRYSRAAFRHRNLVLQHKVIAQLPHFSLEIFAVATILGVILYVQLTTESAAAVVSSATLYAVAGYRMLPAVKAIVQAINEIKLSQPFLDALASDLALDAIPEITGGAENTIALRHRITVDNVSFSYENPGQPNLQGVNISIAKNSSVAFVGPTGAGKTTLMDMILGLFPPDEGRFMIDDVPLDKDNVHQWRKSIGYVPQHIFLTDGTIRSNIAFGIPEAEIDEAAMLRAARLASIDNFIEQTLPNGYDTAVGERGVRLSGGERQRIGIARALYNQPSLLVLDEATSALDGRTEAVIGEAISALSHEVTLIVIAHRLSTVKDCDVIHLMEAGRIMDSGRYDELMARNDVFRAMARA